MTNTRSNNILSGKKIGFGEKIRKYFEDNAFYFLSVSSFLDGSVHEIYNYAVSKKENA